MKSKTCFVSLVLLLSSSLLLAACGPAQTPGPSPTEVAPTVVVKNRSTTITIGTTEKITSFDPADILSSRDAENIMNINEGLLRHKPGTADLEPAQAAGMPTVSSDGLTYTFTLRDGIKFGDGTDLTAQTYAMQLTRLLHTGTNCPDISTNFALNYMVARFVRTITAPDDRTLVFSLKTPAVFFPQILATPYFVPANPALFPVYACVPLPPAPIYGVGPWYISQYAAGDQVIFEPNPYYNGDLKSQVGKIIVKQFADTQALSQAIQGGQVDIAWNTSDHSFDGTFLDPLKKVPGLHIATIIGGYLVYMLINHTMAPMDDPNVVKAIASAIDRQKLIDAAWGGWAVPAYSMIPPGFLGSENTFDTLYGAPNLDKARQYLSASGYTASHPLQLKLWYQAGGQNMPLIKQQLEATGAIQVELTLVEANTFQTELFGGKTYTAGVTSGTSDFADPADNLDWLFYYYGAGTNITSIQGGPQADKASQLTTLLQQADTETDQAKRIDLYKQAQDLLADLVVTLPLEIGTEQIVYRDGIKGSAQYASPETLNIGPMLEFNYSTLVK